MKTFFKLKEELSNISEAADKDMSRELELHSGNDEGAYRHRSAVEKNLSKKFKKGTYDHDKAKKLWQMHADRVAQSYHKQHMDSKTPWHKQINTATRKHAAATMADDWHSEMKAGNFHESVEEGSIKGSGTNRKAELKKAYRAGEKDTRNFLYPRDDEPWKKNIPQPKNKSAKGMSKNIAGIKKAYKAGRDAGGGSATPVGKARQGSQDALRGTNKVHSFYKDSPSDVKKKIKHDTKMYMIHKSKPAGKLPESVELGEGTWALPDSPKAQQILKRLMSKPVKLGKNGKQAKSKFWNIIGDDELMDQIYAAGTKDPNGDARPIVQKWMDKELTDEWKQYHPKHYKK